MDALTKPKRKSLSATGRAYPDLHDHIRALDDAGLLIRVDRPINKDTEMHPLVRWQFRGGIAERDRKAFLFTNVVDAKGRKYDIPVLVGGLAANREIYRIGIGCPFEEIDARWVRAINSPIAPRVVDSAPCQEIVVAGKALDKPGQGLDGLPLPISTPGWDIAPYATLSQYITRDPDTGVQNMGNYRGQVKTRRRLGMNPSLELRPGIYNHWEKLRTRGVKKLPCAVVLGAPPCITFASVQKIPERLDELHVAGALVGAPINVVKAKTVDLMVPAEAEIVIEGFIDTEYLEPEAPFGESHGHVNLQEFNAFMDVTAITRRRDAVLTSIISQVTPSESSLIKRIGMEPLFLNFLRNTLGIKGVKRVSMHEPLTNIRKVIALICERDMPTTEIWRALYGAAVLHRAAGKYVIALNDDIDPENADAILWAMSYRANPNLDMHILPHRDQGHGPRSKRNDGQDASVLIDATLKENFPPISLPKREYMERAKVIWEELGLPKLKPEAPWYGYSLGEWSAELDEAAKRATRGEYFETGGTLEKRRRKDVRMNTEVRNVKERKPKS
ncbi:MAG TPA: UbiD family decarboxylase [Xanthobacteraceae bacterium]|nr:UbiD family decarboxylase [Xanthobacteraceae bacterium]